MTGEEDKGERDHEEERGDEGAKEGRRQKVSSVGEEERVKEGESRFSPPSDLSTIRKHSVSVGDSEKTEVIGIYTYARTCSYVEKGKVVAVLYVIKRRSCCTFAPE